MEPTLTLEAPAAIAARKSPRKVHGVHYTPSELARFVARRVLAQLAGRECVALDPACGEGELLQALALESAETGAPAPQLVGVDRDEAVLALAHERLTQVQASSVTLHHGDFLASTMADTTVLPASYDVVISNPPYVRTQTLGAARAQALAFQFGLTGRVDLYHAFIAAMTVKLAEGGVLGLLCPNRFITTRGGQSLRSLLLANYGIEELWDLGDTKLFDAAVLPAVLVGRRGGKDGKATFVRVYEDEVRDRTAMPVKKACLLSAMESGLQGPVQVGERCFNVERGELLEGAPKRPWQLASPSASRWLAKVRKHSAGRFGDLGAIKVGIKTTADSVFIRASWDDLPRECTPEAELLHPLLTHRVAGRWRTRPNAEGERSLLYPHEHVDGRRGVVDLECHPRAAAYLEQHRARLEARDYVREAGRAWYEIWVPHDPSGWAGRKLVWPDISDRPRFFVDLTGSLVNGDCYWLSCPDASDDEVILALAVTNSDFALRYYDMCCGNRLYSGRRRFVTQYLQDLPIPNASRSELDELSLTVDELVSIDAEESPALHASIEQSLNDSVAELFGLKKEVLRDM
jgi:adenine-specific DNA-methyltransferase